MVNEDEVYMTYITWITTAVSAYITSKQILPFWIYTVEYLRGSPSPEARAKSSRAKPSIVIKKDTLIHGFWSLRSPPIAVSEVPRERVWGSTGSVNVWRLELLL